jgi:hypothetical protein
VAAVPCFTEAEASRSAGRPRSTEATMERTSCTNFSGQKPQIDQGWADVSLIKKAVTGLHWSPTMNRLRQVTWQYARLVLVAMALATGLVLIISLGYNFIHIHW